jgi:hypothetical protein
VNNIPWPFWMLAGFFVLCLLVSGVARLAFEGPSVSSLLEWVAQGTALAAIGYLSFRWLARRRRPFDERWAERTEDGGLDIRDR